jgi:hypothetical protein
MAAMRASALLRASDAGELVVAQTGAATVTIP